MDIRVEKYLDGELDAASIERLLGDAEHDPDLKQDLIRAQALRSSFRAMPRYELPPEVAQRVMAKARSSPAGRSPRRRAIRIAVPVFAAACVAVMFMIGIRPTTPDPEPTPTASEVQRALDDVQLAFALVADVGQRTGEAIRTEILDIPSEQEDESTTEPRSSQSSQSSQQETSP